MFFKDGLISRTPWRNIEYFFAPKNNWISTWVQQVKEVLFTYCCFSQNYQIQFLPRTYLINTLTGRDSGNVLNYNLNQFILKLSIAKVIINFGSRHI